MSAPQTNKRRPARRRLSETERHYKEAKSCANVRL